MKSTIIVLMFITNICIAQVVDNNSIQLSSKYKIENTFSGDLIDTESFHLIFTKNKDTKGYEVFSYFFNGKTITELSVLKSKYSYALVSFHSKEDIVSLLLSYKIKKNQFLKRIDINTSTKDVKESNTFEHKDFQTSFRERDKSILIYKRKEELLIQKFDGFSDVQEERINLENKQDAVYRYFKDQNINSINTNEFVANGSTSKLRAYLLDNRLVFTKENEEVNQTAVLEMSLNSDSHNQETFKNGSVPKYKKHTSYVLDNMLFQLSISKEEGNLKIWDMDNKQTLNSISLDESLTSKIKYDDDFIGISNYLKQASRKKFIPTISVNETLSDSLIIIRLDYVDITYAYNYNWWWHHQQFMMWQQQMHFNNMQHSVPNFGPYLINDYHYNTYIVDTSERHFELLVNTNGVISEVGSFPKTIYRNIDKKDYISTLEDNSDLKHESSCFLKDSFRFIGYSKILKRFIVQTNPLK